MGRRRCRRGVTPALQGDTVETTAARRGLRRTWGGRKPLLRVRTQSASTTYWTLFPTSARPGAARLPQRPCVSLWLRNRSGTLLVVDAVLHALADEGRRTVLERLRERPATAGELADLLPIARPGVSRHLRVLREAGLVEVRPEAQRRVYTLRPEALVEVDAWLDDYRVLWQQRLDALHTEVARGKRARRRST